jgi:hypothetical protein
MSEYKLLKEGNAGRIRSLIDVSYQLRKLVQTLPVIEGLPDSIRDTLLKEYHSLLSSKTDALKASRFNEEIVVNTDDNMSSVTISNFEILTETVEGKLQVQVIRLDDGRMTRILSSHSIPFTKLFDDRG